MKKNISMNHAKKMIDAKVQVIRLSSFLKDTRIQKNLSVKDMIDKSGLTEQSVYKIENNGSASMQSYILYCNCLGIDICKALVQSYIKEL